MKRILLSLGLSAMTFVGCQNKNDTDITPPNPDTTAASLWSEAATWGGAIPIAGSEVVIPVGKRIILDMDATVKNITVLGTLELKDTALKLQTDYIVVRGIFRAGSALKPFSSKAIISLKGTNNENISNMGSRGILVMGGKLELIGAKPSLAWTKLSDHATAGTSNLSLLENTGWKADDQIVIAPTDFYNDGNFQKSPETELLEVQSTSGSSLALKTALRGARWGKLQYAGENGMSLSQGAISLPSTSGRDTGGTTIPTVLDERAEVGNLSRNIIIESTDDTLWKEQGFGAHVMVMGAESSATLEGVELRRVGQAGKFGRYPVHFHNQSYDATGQELPDSSSSLKFSSIWNSAQRCVVIHGTNGVKIQNNICYDIKGHAIFLEDAVERRNVIENNLVLKVREPKKTQALLKHEIGEAFGGTSSGFWIVNPDNTLRGNVAADIVGHGYWLAFPKAPIGVNNKVKLNPYTNDQGQIVGARPERMPFGIFENNVAHSIQDNGVFIDAAPTDARDSSGNVSGETEGAKYIPMQNGKDWGYEFSKWERFTLARVTTYKTGSYWGGGGGIWNRNSYPNFIEWVSADHQGGWFAGAGEDGLIARSLMVGTSLNNAVPRVSQQPLAALASYHSTFDMTQNVILEFPFAEGTENNPSGVFMTADYYITPVDKGLKRNPDNKLINAHPGRRVKPFTQENWTLAGALWDYNGYWGKAGNYWVYDQPFFTSGTSCTQVAPAGKNGASCVGSYYGIGDFVTNFDTDRYGFKHPLEVSRVGTNSATLDTWSVGDGNTAPKLGNMRHFAAIKDGRFILRFPKRSGAGYEIPTRFESTVDNFLSITDSVLFAVQFDGTKNPSISLENGAETRNISTNGANLAAVEADTSGKTYYFDRGNNLLWIKLKGGLTKNSNWNPDPKSNDQLYQSMRLEVI